MTDELDPLIKEIMSSPITLRPDVVEALDQMAEVLLSNDSSSVLHVPMSLAHELGIVIQMGLLAIKAPDEG